MVALSDEISELRLFARIVAAGSLSEAGRRTQTSLPAVSRRLATLEKRLGVRLVERGPRHFTLTEEGAVLHERALAILRDLDAAEAEATATAKQPRGHLRIGAHLEIGRRRIGPMIGEFTAQHPGISVELVLTDAPLNVVEDELDLALHVERSPVADAVSRVVLASNRVVCCSPQYAETHGRIKRPLDLLQHDCICLLRGRHVFDQWVFKENGRTAHVQVRGSLLTSSGEVLHDWALAGRGVALKWRWDVQDDLRTGRLLRLLEPFECDEASLYLTYPNRSYLPPRARLFIDFIVNALQETATT
jgi:DNA-binding transcriptional LysR family regulator